MEHAQSTQSTLTVLTLLAKYDQAHPEQDAGTRAMRHLVFDQFVAVCGEISLEDFSLSRAEEYRSALLGGWRPRTAEELSRMNCRLSGRARTGLMKGFAPVTAASYLKMIRAPFRWWTIHRRTNVDFWGQLPPIPRVRRPVKVYSDDRLAKLLAEARRVQDGGLTEARVLVMVTAGLRRAECQQLIESDIDWDRGTITVQPHEETETTWRWTPKDRDWRTVPLVDQAKAVLLARRHVLPAEQPYLLISAERYAYLMYLRSQGQMTDRQRKLPDENHRPFRRLRMRAGTAGLSQKHLRSTAATNWLRDGIDLRSVQALMGHSEIATTEKYLTPDVGAVEKARTLGAARLLRLAGGTPPA